MHNWLSGMDAPDKACQHNILPISISYTTNAAWHIHRLWRGGSSGMCPLPPIIEMRQYTPNAPEENFLKILKLFQMETKTKNLNAIRYFIIKKQ